MAIRRLASGNARQTTLRHVWLASLGVASLVTTDTIKARNHILATSERLHQRARGFADLAGRVFASGPLGPAIAAFEEGIGTLLAPAMRKLALRPHAKAGKVRRPTARKSARGGVGMQSRSKR